MKRLSLMLAGAMLLMAGECSPPAELSSPLSEPGQAAYDERLVGTWISPVWEDSGDLGPSSQYSLMLTIRAHPNGFLIVDYNEMTSSVEEDLNGAVFFWARRTAYASVVDGETYYNSTPVDSFVASKSVGAAPTTEAPADSDHFTWFTPDPARGYWIFHAVLPHEEVLMLTYLSAKDLEEAGIPKKVVSCGEDCEFATFDLSSEELVALFRQAQADDDEEEDFFTGRIVTFIRVPSKFWPPADLIDPHERD